MVFSPGIGQCFEQFFEERDILFVFCFYLEHDFIEKSAILHEVALRQLVSKAHASRMSTCSQIEFENLDKASPPIENQANDLGVSGLLPLRCLYYSEDPRI